MEKIGAAVDRELRRSGDGRAHALAEITAAWPTAVGDTVARNAWPLRVGRDGTLHVATSSSTWAFELDRLAPDVLARLSERLGEAAPRTLRFRPGPVPEPPAQVSPGPSDSAEQAPPATPEDTAEAAEIAAAVADPDLRALVERAARASLARSRSGRSF